MSVCASMLFVCVCACMCVCVSVCVCVCDRRLVEGVSALLLPSVFFQAGEIPISRESQAFKANQKYTAAKQTKQRA